jgi:pilus assembly protein CpaD
VGPGGLDGRQSQDVRDFAEEYRKSGDGAITVQMPGHTRNAAETRRTLDAVQAALRAGGVPGAAWPCRLPAHRSPPVASRSA